MDNNTNNTNIVKQYEFALIYCFKGLFVLFKALFVLFVLFDILFGLLYILFVLFHILFLSIVINIVLYYFFKELFTLLFYCERVERVVQNTVQRIVQYCLIVLLSFFVLF